MHSAFMLSNKMAQVGMACGLTAQIGWHGPRVAAALQFQHSSNALSRALLYDDSKMNIAVIMK